MVSKTKPVQTNLFGTEIKQNIEQAIAITKEKLKYHVKENHHLVCAFSGGKDSTTVVTLVMDLLAKKEIPQPKSFTVVYADTRMEIPLLHSSAIALLEKVKQQGYQTRIAVAPLDKRFLVYILGRGVPPPNNSTMRWCTQAIKVNPMMAAIDDIRQSLNTKERILMLTGVRIGESVARDRLIYTSCSKNGAECGQGWFQVETDVNTDTLAPIDHWRVCNVWDWLMFFAPSLGFSTELLAEVYGGDEATEINARTGCMGCPLASEDKALNYLLRNPKYSYLAPLGRLRPIYQSMRSFSDRLQKATPEILKDGSWSKAGNRKGPLTLAARLKYLDQILNIQNEVNHLATAQGMPAIDLINSEEESRIRELIALGTYPQKWDGNEPLGSDLIPYYFSDGSKQPVIPGL